VKLDSIISPSFRVGSTHFLWGEKRKVGREEKKGTEGGREKGQGIEERGIKR